MSNLIPIKHGLKKVRSQRSMTFCQHHLIVKLLRSI